MFKNFLAQKDHQNNPSLNTSFIVGIFGCTMAGFTQDFFAPFLLILGGSTFHISILSSLTNLFSSMGQLPSADLTVRLGSRKKVGLLFLFLQICTLLTLVIFTSQQLRLPYVLIALVVSFTTFGAISNPSWISLLSDLVHTNKRGAYFGWRARNLGFITILSAFTAGIILHYFNNHNVFIGFLSIFTLASISRIFSFMALKRIDEPVLHITKEHSFSLWQFFKQSRKSNFAQFVFFAASVNFCVNLAAPFFSVFMLKDLSLNYFYYTSINVAAPVALYAIISRWGWHADHIGNLKVLKVVAPLLGLIPLLWIFNQNIFFLLATEMLAGFLWAGFNLCSSNFIMDAVTPEKRTRCFAYFHVINGFALALGAFLGGQLLNILPPLAGHKILSLFLISSGLRVLVGILLPRRLKEVRPVASISSQELLFSMIGVKPIAGIERKSLQL